VRVLIVDDHPVVVSGCKTLLAAEPGVEVVDAADGKSGYAAYFAHHPDVAVIDLNLPGVSGLELCRRILRRDQGAQLVIFSVNEDSFFASRAIEAGAKGYIAKSDDPLLFLEAVRRIANGGVYLHPEMANEIAFNRARSGMGRFSGLNARELEILRLLASGNTLLEISEILNVSYKTAANNYTVLKQKLGARGTAELTKIAVDSKLV
jgi:two-component system, NarL family, invasion response regulator UvrY